VANEKIVAFSTCCKFLHHLLDFSACAPERPGLNTASPKAGTLEGPGRGAGSAVGPEEILGMDDRAGRREIGVGSGICFLCFLTLMDI
jgi:hypothetical protein